MIGMAAATVGGATLWLKAQRNDHECLALETEESCRALGLPTPAEAQRIPAVRLPAFLSNAEIQRLRDEVAHAQIEQQVGMLERDVNESPTAYGVWRTSYLHTGGFLRQRMPELHAKLQHAMKKVDAEHWQLLSQKNDRRLHLRTCECHEYGAGGGLSTDEHFDAGSCITIDVMLAEPGVDFQGGALVMPEVQAGVSGKPVYSRPRFNRGDAVVFPSHKYHNVEPVTKGKRMVLVAELWEGPEKECAHRCLTTSQCGYTLHSSHMKDYAQQIAQLG